MPYASTAERVEGIRESVRSTRHINVTELARGKAWRTQLPECDVIEIIDRGANAGWLVSDAGMDSLLDTISYLEQQLEQAHMQAIVNARASYDNWLEDEELTKAALESLDERGEDIREALDAG